MQSRLATALGHRGIAASSSLSTSQAASTVDINRSGGAASMHSLVGDSFAFQSSSGPSPIQDTVSDMVDVVSDTRINAGSAIDATACEGVMGEENLPGRQWLGEEEESAFVSADDGDLHSHVAVLEDLLSQSMAMTEAYRQKADGYRHQLSDVVNESLETCQLLDRQASTIQHLTSLLQDNNIPYSL